MSINRITLLGNVGGDPEIRTLDGGVKVATFTLATTERSYTKRDGTVVPERTEWHNIVLWRGLADIAEKYIRKGTKLYIEGPLRTRNYDDRNGVKKYVAEVYADNLELLGSQQPAQPQQQAPAPMPQQTQSYGQTTAPGYNQQPPQSYQPIQQQPAPPQQQGFDGYPTAADLPPYFRQQ